MTNGSPTPQPRLTNLTILVDDFVLLHARWRALKEGTSVNAVLEAYLAEYAGVPAAPRPRRLPRPPRPMDIYREGLRRHRSGY